MSDFAPISVAEVCDLLIAAERPIILSHVRPDGDTVGSAAALSAILAAMGKRVAWDCADPLPKRLAFLFEGLTLATPEENAGGTVIAVDVAAPGQLGAMREKYPSVALSIDHHGTGELFAPSLVCPQASATGEVLFAVAEELIARGALAALPRHAARAIYAAISSDTGCFKYANVTPATHRVAAALLSSDIGADRINYLLYDSRSPSQLAAEKIALSRLSARYGGKIAAVCLSLSDREGLSEEDFETAIDIARSMAGAEIALAIRELSGGVCKVSLRSTEANVAEVAQSFGGGGHARAAGCTVLGEPQDALEVLLPSLIAALKK